ncbi:cyclic lactone autoinducer peptide [Aneurinibacillus sp. REN35]
MKRKLFYYVATAFSVLATLIITPNSLTFLHAPEVPEELK